MTELLEQIKEMTDNIENIRKEQQAVVQKAFAETAKTILQQNSDIIKGFSWTQYTPYFNDGEPCVFHINKYSLEFILPDNTISGEDVYGDNVSKIDPFGYKGIATKEFGYGDNKTPNPDYDPKYGEVKEAVEGFLFALPEDSLKELFNDHCKVTVTLEGVTVEEYDHE